jgi:cyclic pyranopterin monophosphate synthase
VIIMAKKITAGDQMVDVGDKAVTIRSAKAMARVSFSPQVFKLFQRQGSPKGDVLETARIAGVMAAKRTPLAIPFCHPLVLDKVKVETIVEPRRASIVIYAEVKSQGRTGVEMEALHAVSVAALTVYDMTKRLSHAIKITDIKLLEKHGGKSGDYFAPGLRSRS